MTVSPWQAGNLYADAERQRREADAAARLAEARAIIAAGPEAQMATAEARARKAAAEKDFRDAGKPERFQQHEDGSFTIDRRQYEPGTVAHRLAMRNLYTGNELSNGRVPMPSEQWNAIYDKSPTNETALFAHGATRAPEQE